MRNAVPAKTAKSATETESTAVFERKKSVSIRVSPNSYFTALFLGTFFSGFLIYLEWDLWAVLLLIISWVAVPLLAWFDRIVFDGKRLIRTGFFPRLWSGINHSKYRLKISDIEQVETQALRALKRGGNVFYRYRTSVNGKGLQFAFASGGEEYRRMVHMLFPLISENSLDNRSIELRDYLAEPKETLMKAEFAKIPSAEVLENFIHNQKLSPKPNFQKVDENEKVEKADYLRRLANELRLSGYLVQSLEAFRRALVLNPKDAWLLFEFARCLHSLAGSERDARLQKKAFAALRLAEKRGRDDSGFLERLGESYFQYGDWRRAYKVFHRAIDSAEVSFRSVRGLAEIALREGKIAHVIHHFATANRLAETPALRRWTQAEGEYFSRLNEDEDYMEMEVSRVNMLESLERSRKTSLRVAVLGFPLILVGLVFQEQLVANIGWAVSTVALLVWLGLILSRNLLSSRVPVDLDVGE
ncbi:MAG: tetratricopeptide repeat protein [Pyrinomonadaceae bacterium]